MRGMAMTEMEAITWTLLSTMRSIGSCYGQLRSALRMYFVALPAYIACIVPHAQSRVRGKL